MKVTSDRRVEISGDVFAGQSGVSVPATLILSEGLASLRTPDNNTLIDECSTDVLKIDPKLGKTTRKIYFPNGAIFEVQDREALENITGRGFWHRLSRLERFGWHLVPFIILTPIVAYGLYRLMVPYIIGAALHFTPDAVVRTMDASTMKSVDVLLTNESELPQEKQDELTAVFNTLLRIRDNNSEQSGNSRIINRRLLFRSSKRLGPNAFALPGGTIVITDDLVKLVDDPDIIAAILAHELGHVEHEHSLRQLYRVLGIAGMFAVVAGDAGPLLEDVIVEGGAIMSLSFSRKHELEADRYSFNLLEGTQYPSDGLIMFFETMEDMSVGSDEGEWLSTHPISSKRIEQIRSLKKNK